MYQQLSPAAQAALDSLKNLAEAERKQVLDLANQIQDAASAATTEQRAVASSAINDGVQTALVRGFKQVVAPDGKAAIQVSIMRPDGTEVRCLLAEGARGKRFNDLALYGIEKLNGALLLSRADFEAIVDSLYAAIQGMTLLDGVLQTDDPALRRAYEIMKQGVRRGGINACVSNARFELDYLGPELQRVAARLKSENRYIQTLGEESWSCALFGYVTAELQSRRRVQ